MYSPCKDCQTRELYCHSKCEKYLEYSEFRQETLKKQHLESQLRTIDVSKRTALKRSRHLSQ